MLRTLRSMRTRAQASYMSTKRLSCEALYFAVKCEICMGPRKSHGGYRICFPFVGMM